MKYQAPDIWLNNPPSNIILTQGQPVLYLVNVNAKLGVAIIIFQKLSKVAQQNNEDNLSCDMRKPTKWLCARRRLRSAWASAQSDQSLRCAHEESLGP